VKIEQVLIVGAGSVGGFFGAHLARQHAGVSFLLRPRTLEAVQQRGLTIRSGSGSFTVHPPAASDPTQLPGPDLVILSVKTYDLDEVMDQLEPVLSDRTILLTLQNGVDTEDRLLKRFERDCVVGGVAFIYSRVAEPGVIEHYKRGSVAIGEMLGHKSERVQSIAEFFRSASLQCQIVEDIRRSKWEKMCWNCVFNPLTVIINDRVSKALGHPELLGVIRQIVQEVTVVASAEKIYLDADMPEKVIRWSQEIRDIHTSMYDDWKAGRRTEIDYLNGYIVRRGRDFGIPTPLNESLTAMIKVITERQPVESFALSIEGAVLQPLTLDRDALAKLPADHQVPDVGAIVPGARGYGIRLKALLEMPAPDIGADHVTFHSGDGQFAASLSLAQAMEHGILIYQLDGKALPEARGGPFRLVTPGMGDLCAHLKGVTRIEFTRGHGKDTRPSSEARAKH
jgi:2-dehydropantoate 2-reductase